MLNPSNLQAQITEFKQKGFLLDSNGTDYTIKSVDENQLNFAFDFIGSAWNGNSIILLKKNESNKDILDYYMLTSNKKIVNLENSFGSLEHFEMESDGLYRFSIFNAEGVIEWGVMNNNAQIIIEPIYNEIEFIEDSFIKIYLSRATIFGYGLYGMDGQQILPAKFEFIDVDFNLQTISADTADNSIVLDFDGNVIDELKNDSSDDFYN